jgi:hypothetical protein
MNSKQNLRLSTVIQKCATYFNILAVISVVEYDYCPNRLFKLLSSLKKDTFAPNDRIIFHFDDTEYYIDQKYGVILHNIQKILYKLDIPNYFCIMLTHQDHRGPETIDVQKLYGHDPYRIGTIYSWIDVDVGIDTVKSIELNLHQIEKSFTYLSRIPRKHRIALFSLLHNKNILDRGLVSFSLNNQSSQIITSDLLDEDIPYIDFITISPFNRCNENWLINSDKLKSTYDTFLKSVTPDFSYKNFVEHTPESGYWIYHNTIIIQKGFLYITNETMMSYPGIYLTEKSFKGIEVKRPFVMLGPMGNLKKLKSYGFQTFDRWWDESYDNIQDPAERIEAVYKIIYDISQKSTNQLIALGKDMESVLNYNYNFFINEFNERHLQNIDSQCLANLQRSKND